MVILLATVTIKVPWELRRHMPTFTYTDDIPDANHNPSTDQPDMKINTNSIDSIIAVDHYSFEEGGLDRDGYHKIIHQAVEASDPTTIALINQIYPKNYTPDTTGGVADTQLFTRTASGAISQLTGNFLNAEGWQWIGGVLVQWGAIASTSSSGTVIFKDRVAGAIPFPNNCFNVSITLSSTAGFTTTCEVGVRDFTNLQFRWRSFNLSLGGSDGFYWIAIGN